MYHLPPLDTALLFLSLHGWMRWTSGWHIQTDVTPFLCVHPYHPCWWVWPGCTDEWTWDEERWESTTSTEHSSGPLSLFLSLALSNVEVLRFRKRSVLQDHRLGALCWIGLEEWQAGVLRLNKYFYKSSEIPGPGLVETTWKPWRFVCGDVS